VAAIDTQMITTMYTVQVASLTRKRSYCSTAGNHANAAETPPAND